MLDLMPSKMALCLSLLVLLLSCGIEAFLFTTEPPPASIPADVCLCFYRTFGEFPSSFLGLWIDPGLISMLWAGDRFVFTFRFCLILVDRGTSSDFLSLFDSFDLIVEFLGACLVTDLWVPVVIEMVDRPSWLLLEGSFTLLKAGDGLVIDTRVEWKLRPCW